MSRIVSYLFLGAFLFCGFAAFHVSASATPYPTVQSYTERIDTAWASAPVYVLHDVAMVRSPDERSLKHVASISSVSMPSAHPYGRLVPADIRHPGTYRAFAVPWRRSPQ